MPARAGLLLSSMPRWSFELCWTTRGKGFELEFFFLSIGNVEGGRVDYVFAVEKGVDDRMWVFVIMV